MTPKIKFRNIDGSEIKELLCLDCKEDISTITHHSLR